MQGIDALLAQFKGAESKSKALKETCLLIVNKHVPGALEGGDFELGSKGVLHLKDSVGSSARSEIALFKKAILEDLAATLGKAAPYDIR